MNEFPLGRTVKLLEGVILNLRVFLKHNQLEELREEIAEANYRIELFLRAKVRSDSLVDRQFASAGQRYLGELRTILTDSTRALRSSLRACVSVQEKP